MFFSVVNIDLRLLSPSKKGLYKYVQRACIGGWINRECLDKILAQEPKYWSWKKHDSTFVPEWEDQDEVDIDKLCNNYVYLHHSIMQKLRVRVLAFKCAFVWSSDILCITVLNIEFPCHFWWVCTSSTGRDNATFRILSDPSLILAGSAILSQIAIFAYRIFWHQAEFYSL